jgi:flagellin
VQTAEGALNESHSILQRMRDLSVQASNDGGLNDDAKGAIQSEVGQLKSELTRIADTTTFNGKKLLDGNYDGKFQVGANAGETDQRQGRGRTWSARPQGRHRRRQP